jgi:DNA-binding LacI/PurR family transcriptional regulator
MNHAYICDAIRTPFGRYGSALSSVRADDLAAIPIRALMARNPQVDWAAIDDVLLGCANQAGEDNRNVARMAAGTPLTDADRAGWLAEHVHPPLSTVRQPIADARPALVQPLLSRLAGERCHSTQLATTLVMRDSSGAPCAA